MQKLPPLTWLRAFEAAARHMSFTLAAEELHLTQAAISKQVRLLEHYLREPLFERRPRSLVLTKVGSAYLPKVEDAFARLAAGTQEVFGNRKGEMLTVRCAVGFAVNWLASRLPAFFAAHPAIQLRIVSSVWTEGGDSETFDLDIRYGFGRWPGFKVDRLSWDVMEPLCVPELAHKLTRPDDLASTRLLHVLGYQEGWSNWLAHAGASKVNAGSGMHFDTSLLAFEVAAQGGGVALGRRCMSGRELASGRLVRPFDIALPTEEAFYLLRPDAGAEHPDATAFRAFLIEAAERDRNLNAP